ncbi:porin [Photobacterium profundum]|uniref:Porin domain-containing protein n=1 Tax=Photobacterium profundum (strain SS9) TaxID=298386 RepID=Q6LI54_PHOPR|nr:porin [Photobacterium profundum]CAG23026.1 hypothetical protein PBPRB1154 [Photobacterium profundum SS9]
MNKTLLSIIIIAALPFCSQAAIDVTDNFSISGFGSTSITQSDNKTPLFVNREITDDTCYDCDTIFGLQADWAIWDELSASVQVVKRPQDNWSEPEVEWAYLAYHYNSLSFKAGRLRLPLFLASEYYYVGQAYTWARPPQEVYDSILGFNYFDGLSVSWEYDLSDEIVLTTMPLYGFSNTNKTDYDSVTLEFDTERVAGISFDFSGFNYRIHMNYMNAKYRIVPSPTYETLNIYTFGAEYSLDQWHFMAEVETDEIQTNWYTSASYNIDKFTPYMVYGESHQRRKSNSITTGVRYDITHSISVNAEWQNIFMDREDYNAGNSGQFVTPPIAYGEDKDVQLYTVMLNFIF